MHERLTAVSPDRVAKTIHPALYEDDSNGTFQWIVTGTGTDYSAAYQNTLVFTGLKALELRTRATTPTINDLIRIDKLLWLPPQNLARLQCVFMNGDNTCDFVVYIGLRYYTGAAFYDATVRITSVGRAVALSIPPDQYATLAGLTWCDVAYAWNYLDLSVDLLNGTYKSLVLNNRAIDISAYTPDNSASATQAHLALTIRLVSQEAARARLILDQILLTPELR